MGWGCCWCCDVDIYESSDRKVLGIVLLSRTEIVFDIGFSG